MKKFLYRSYRGWCCLGIMTALSLGMVRAQVPEVVFEDASRLSETELRNLVELPSVGFLSELEGGRSYSGKKTFFVDPASGPFIHNNNFRQLLKKKTGVFLEEQEIQGTNFNIGYRGMAPNNGNFTQVYVDGFPMNNDVFGTRFVLGLPDLNSTSQVQFVTGGSGVLFGPQAGGAVQFLSYPAAGDQAYRLTNTVTAGSYGSVTELFEASGTVDSLSYAVFGRYADGGGFAEQPAFDHVSGGARVTIRASERDTLTLGYQIYRFSADHSSSVALSGAGVNKALNYYYEDATKHYATLLWEHEYASSSRLESRSWYSHTRGLRDFSAGTTGLGVVTEQIHYAGTDNRLIHEYDLGDLAGNVLTLGFLLQGSESPLDSSGATALDLDRHDLNSGVYIENKFQLTDRWSVTPGFRFEYAEVGGDGFRSAGMVDRDFNDTEALFSFSTEVDVFESTIDHRPLVAYANVSNAYRAPTYNETVNQGFGVVLDGSLDNATIIQIEGGIRGTPVPWYTYDFSAFWMEYDDQFATVGNTVVNAGRTEHYGVELFDQVDIFAFYDWLSGVQQTKAPKLGPSSPEDKQGLARYGKLNLYGAVTYLQVDLEKTPFAGNRDHAVYAPDLTFKCGLEYNYFERFKTTLNFLYVADHFGDTANTNSLIVPATGVNEIPSYTVLDIAAQYTFWDDYVTAFVGINNVLDENYFASKRVGTGRFQAPGQNVYGGVRVQF